MTATQATRLLLSMLDVDAAHIQDGETIVWSEEVGAFVPAAAGGGGGGGGGPIEGGATAVVVDRAAGFVSPWLTFDLLGPGVGYGKMLVTAADPDGLAWATDVGPFLEAEVSVDGVSWFRARSTTSAGQWPVGLYSDLGTEADPVGKTSEYNLITPRFMRVRAVVSDINEGGIYAGASDPSFTCDLTYTGSGGGGGGGGSVPYVVATKTLTPAEITTLHAASVVLDGAPAPGVGKGYVVLGVQTQCFPGATLYTLPDNSLLEVGPKLAAEGDWCTWATQKPTQGSALNRVLNAMGGTDTVANWTNTQWASPGSVSLIPPDLIENQPLAIANPGDEFTDGDGDLYVAVVAALVDVVT